MDASRIGWVVDHGFSSADNRRMLQRGGHHWIMGEASDSKAEDTARAR